MARTINKEADGFYPTIVYARSVPYCVDCFVSLPEKTRQGQGARKISWLPDPNDVDTVCCSKCKKRCVDSSLV